ncbi:hypothetical protein [Rhizobium sp.]|jgi:hypothetical protein|uniref:hypothetical protein n=1 Tax=Rhizobium sp. TaxID=391 RepID=UPI000E987923|nr:hypothetical protein [Rhizobium sp.]
MVMFSSSRVIAIGFVFLAIAAVVFAAWPRRHEQAAVPALFTPQATVAPASSGASTFGGSVAKSRPDIRASGLYSAPVSGN